MSIPVFFFSSAVAQNTADWNMSNVYTFDPDSVKSGKIAAQNLIVSDKYSVVVGKCNYKKHTTIKLWNLKDGVSELIMDVENNSYKPDNEYGELLPLLISHDKSKIVICVNYRISIDEKKYKQTLWGDVYTGDTKKECTLICYSIPDRAVLWKTETERLDNSIFDHGTGIWYDDSFVYAIGCNRITIFDMASGAMKYDDLKLFPKALTTNCLNPREICVSPSGRYIAYFKEASYMNFNLYLGSTVYVWDTVEKRIICKKFVKGRGVRRIAFLPDEQGILTVNNDRTLRLLSMQEQQVKDRWKLCDDFGLSEVVSSGEQQLILANGCPFSIWLFPQIKQIFRSNNYSIYSYGALANDGKSLVLSQGGYLYLLDTSDWSVKWRVPIE